MVCAVWCVLCGVCCAVCAVVCAVWFVVCAVWCELCVMYEAVHDDTSQKEVKIRAMEHQLAQQTKAEREAKVCICTSVLKKVCLL